jgi:hypothetical protein
MQGLIEGRVVHYVIAEGQHRAALVVRVWNKETGCSNLQVFVDGTNDSTFRVPASSQISGMMWKTSVSYDDKTKKVGTWHYPEHTKD